MAYIITQLIKGYFSELLSNSYNENAAIWYHVVQVNYISTHRMKDILFNIDLKSL